MRAGRASDQVLFEGDLRRGQRTDDRVATLAETIQNRRIERGSVEDGTLHPPLRVLGEHEERLGGRRGMTRDEATRERAHVEEGCELVPGERGIDGNRSPDQLPGTRADVRSVPVGVLDFLVDGIDESARTLEQHGDRRRGARERLERCVVRERTPERSPELRARRGVGVVRLRGPCAHRVLLGRRLRLDARAICEDLFGHGLRGPRVVVMLLGALPDEQAAVVDQALGDDAPVVGQRELVDADRVLAPVRPRLSQVRRAEVREQRDDEAARCRDRRDHLGRRPAHDGRHAAAAALRDVGLHELERARDQLRVVRIQRTHPLYPTRRLRAHSCSRARPGSRERAALAAW